MKLILPERKLLLPLDHTRIGQTEKDFYDFLKTRGVGQPRIFKWCAKTAEAVFEGFFPGDGPPSVLLIGVSGAGKTLAAKLLAWFLFGDPEGYTRVDGQDVSLEHGVARIIGAPPGYVGYDDEPMITQMKLDRPAFESIVRYALREATDAVRKEYAALQEEKKEFLKNIAELGSSKAEADEKKELREKLKSLTKRTKDIGIPTYDRTIYKYPSVLLLDEVEKGHPIAYPNILLRILDEGKLQISSKHGAYGSNTIDFRRTIIIATSNLGSDELKKFFRVSSGRSAGYRFVTETYTSEELDRTVYRICRKAVDTFFSTEFVNRFGDVIAARPHPKEDLIAMLELELNKFRDRLFDQEDLNFPILLHVDGDVKEYLVGEVLDSPEKGGRFLQQKLKKRIYDAVLTFKSTEQLHQGDVLHVSLAPSKTSLFFQKENSSTTKTKVLVTSK